MNIKTITCHEVYNYGASLQEYALLTYLKSQGHEAETIHYKPDYLSGHFSLKTINPQYDKTVIKQLYQLAKLPGHLKDLKRKKAFDSFSQKHITTNAIRYSNNDELKANLPVADAYICGSDQIWNPVFPNGKDLAFYLDFVPDDRIKIAYAASFAVDEIDDDQKKIIKEQLNRFNAISVRETSGLKILKETEIGNAIQVMDPVFLLPASFWIEKFVQPVDDNYIFVYDCDSNPLIRLLAKKIAQNNRCKIYTVNKNITYSDKSFYLHDPGMFLSLIYNARYVLTNSFHALAFSLIFEKQFLEVDRIENINTRMRDLLKLFGLEHRTINDIADLSSIQNIDYNKIRPLIVHSIDRSKMFLEILRN